MPSPGHIWWHLILNTHCSWLHGDRRGFRSRDHRIHSSGDYKHRPPPQEHEGLGQYHRQHSQPAVCIRPDLQSIVGQRIVNKAQQQGHRLLVFCCGVTHAHGLAELPDEYELAKKVLASWKQAGSHAVSLQLPGRIWSQGGPPIAVRSRSHFEQVYPYIHAHKENAWVWELNADAGVRQW